MGKKEKIAEYFREKRAKVREGEKIGGGYVVFAIDPESGRIMPPPVPFEHSGLRGADKAVKSLSAANPDRAYVIYRLV